MTRNPNKTKERWNGIIRTSDWNIQEEKRPQKPKKADKRLRINTGNTIDAPKGC